MAESLPLKELLDFTRDGEWGKGESSDDLVEMAVIRGTDFLSVRRGDISTVPRRFIPRKAAERKVLMPGDILIETAGGTKDQPTGRTVYLSERIFEALPVPVTCASFSRFLRVKRKLVNPQYLFLYLQSIYSTGEMLPYHIQHTGVARFQYTDFASQWQVPLPPLEEQAEIADTLSIFDDKIELNRRMNEALEAMARAIFKDWFVDFGPIRAKAEGRAPYLVPELWDLFPDALDDEGKPAGWRYGKLDDLIVLQRGFDLPKSKRVEGKYLILAASGVNGTHNEAKVPGPGVSTGRSGVIGNVFYVYEDFWPLNTSLWVKKYRNSSPAHAYFLIQTLDFASFNSGSAVPTLNRNHVHNLPMAVPSPETIQGFDRFVGPLFQRKRVNDVENKTLAQTRDLLLPKLMSGEIRLREAEKTVEAAA